MVAADSLPLHYQEAALWGDSSLHAEADSVQYGEIAEILPYSASHDDVITLLLLVGFFFLMVSVAYNFEFIKRQLRHFFNGQNSDSSIIETGTELRLQLIMVIVTCLSYALLAYLYATHDLTVSYILSSEYLLLLLFFGAFLLFYALRFLLYQAVNLVFFDNVRNKKFLTSLLFVSAIEAVMLFPLVLLLVYFQFAPRNALTYCIIVLVLVKILTIYKAYLIFFKQNSFFLQIFLYFCTLEIVPLFSLLGGLAVIVKSLKVIF